MAVDGVSLTVAALARGPFDVMIIPFTWEHTSLAALRPGAQVNLECDMVGKYVAPRGRTLVPTPMTQDAKIRIAKGARASGPFASIDDADRRHPRRAG